MDFCVVLGQTCIATEGEGTSMEKMSASPATLAAPAKRRSQGPQTPAPDTLLGLSESDVPLRATAEDTKRIREHEEFAARDPQAYMDACRAGML
jgi:hypothetical protein